MAEQNQEDVRQSDMESLRILQLDALFQTGKIFTKKELEEKLGFSAATVQRDLKKLRITYHAPLEYNRDPSRKEGWHYTDKLYKLPALFVPENAMPAYGLVRKLLALFKDTPLYNPLQDICGHFGNPIKSDVIPNVINPQHNQMEFKASPLKEDEWFETRIVVAGRQVDLVDKSVWNTIISALKDNLVLEFDYESVETNKETWERKLEPWQLIYDRGQWYLRGLDQNKKEMRTFVVPRMTNVTPTKQHFALPEDEKVWRHDKYSIGYFGIMTTNAPEQCRFIFQGSALYFSKAKFAKDTKVEPYNGDIPHKEGAVLVSFTSNQRPAILKEFFPFGADIIPLAPESLVQEWKDKVRAMAKYL